MAIKLSSLKTDAAKERDGVWVHFEKGVEFLLARLGNPRYNEAVFSLMNKRGISAVGLTPEQMSTRADFVALSRRATAEAVLIGWRGPKDPETGEHGPAFVDDAGEPIPYSPDAAEALLAESTDVERFVGQNTIGREIFRRDSAEASKGNSVPV